jgi:hypothetical protein
MAEKIENMELPENEEKEKLIINAKFIQERLKERFSGHKYVLCNSYVFDWESDFFSKSTTGYVYEIEIKVSRSDFRADFDKVVKHKALQEAKRLVICHRGSVKVKYDKEKKEYVELYCNVAFRENYAPNKFFYATPVGLLKESDIPEYAGWIEISDYEVIIRKESPFLHKRKMDLNEKLLDKFYWRSVHLAFDLYQVKRDLNNIQGIYQ